MTSEEEKPLKVPSNQPQYPFVPDLPRYTRHQYVMIHAVKELFQVDVDHPSTALGHVLPWLLYRLVGASARSKAVTSGHDSSAI